MTKDKVEALCVEWLSERLDPNDKEGLAAFQDWMERFSNNNTGSVTVGDVLAAWESIRERRKLHRGTKL
jgi:hypothetical protein